MRPGLALAALLGLGLSACQRGPLVLDERHSGRTFTIRQGEPLTVVLRSNQSTGYRWVLDPDPAPVLRLTGVAEYVQDSAPPGQVGVPGHETWRFEAARPGLVTLQLAYRRPWDRGKAPEREFVVDVTVK